MPPLLCAVRPSGARCRGWLAVSLLRFSWSRLAAETVRSLLIAARLADPVARHSVDGELSAGGPAVHESDHGVRHEHAQVDSAAVARLEPVRRLHGANARAQFASDSDRRFDGAVTILLAKQSLSTHLARFHIRLRDAPVVELHRSNRQRHLTASHGTLRSNSIRSLFCFPNDAG